MKTIHPIVRRGDVEALRRLLTSASDPKALANEVEEDGDPPLFKAVRADPPKPEIVRLLLEAGADPGYVKAKGAYSESLLSVALKGSGLETIRLLREHGADFAYRSPHNYTAILDALFAEGDRVEIVRYLIGLGLDVDATSSYGESPVSVASYGGKFEALAELLKAGADEAPLGWTPLHRAAALGTAADVERELDRGGDPRAYERWRRTALHIALRRGSEEIVERLLRRGADLGQAAQNGTPSLVYAAESGQLGLIARVLASGVSPEDKDAALDAAIERDAVEVAQILLEAGADPRSKRGYEAPIARASGRDMILLLHRHGANLDDLETGGRRALLGFGEGDDDALDSVSRETYLAGRYPQEGQANPERVGDPFQLAMIRCGWSAYGARKRYDDPPDFERHLAGEAPPAVWCFDRFGQSTTLLPDGRIVLVAGEHEDYYDPDFRIYNDVTVFDPAGGLTLYGYPYGTFPPTDFHSATLVGGWIYLVGSLGYTGSREGGMPVYRLSVEDFRIEPVATRGEGPGRIYRHRAALLPGDRIRIEGGTRISFQGSEEAHAPNEEAFVLDVATRTWSRA